MCDTIGREDKIGTKRLKQLTNTLAKTQYSRIDSITFTHVQNNTMTVHTDIILVILRYIGCLLSLTGCVLIADTFPFEDKLSTNAH